MVTDGEADDGTHSQCKRCGEQDVLGRQEGVGGKRSVPCRMLTLAWCEDREMAIERPMGIRRSPIISKRDLLLLRGVAVMDLEEQLEAAEPHVVADCEYLEEQGFLRDAPGSASDVGDYLGAVFADEIEMLARIPYEERRALISRELDEALRMGSSGRHPSVGWDDEILPLGGELAVAYAFTMAGETSSAVMDRRPSPEEWLGVQRKLALPRKLRGGNHGIGVVELVLEELPIPGDDVPLYEVLDFVRDDAMASRLEGLNLWIQRATLEGQDLQDVQLALKEGLHDFGAHMKAARIRYETGVVRLTVTSALGVIEELLHFRPRRALDAAMKFRELEASQLEAEVKAPGTRLSYIYEPQRRFRQ